MSHRVLLSVAALLLLGHASSALATPTLVPEERPSTVKIPQAVLDTPGVELPDEIRRSATGSEAWQELVNQIHGDGEAFDAPIRRHDRPTLGVDTIRTERNLIIVEDTDGSIEANGFTGNASMQVLQELASTVYAQYPDEFDFVTILTNWTIQVPTAYYLPLSNDTLGIGLRHFSPVGDIFDDTEGKLQGFIFMNNWRLYTGENVNLNRIIWLQEIGHRWGAFVHVDKEGVEPDALLGRDRSHWSYFMHSMNSALEGNDWLDNEDGSFTTVSNGSRMTFSNLDLYLMGILPTQEVPPFYVIQNPDTRNLRDVYGARLNPASPPEFQGDIRTIFGDRTDLTIEDVVASEGPRNPGYRDAQKTWRMATVFVVRRGTVVTDEMAQAASGVIDHWVDLFEEGTRYEMDLIANLDGQELETGLRLGQPCETSEQCDNETATTCIATEGEEKICSKRCFADEECGPGFCCDDPTGEGSLFCYPSEGGGSCINPAEEPDMGIGSEDEDGATPDEDNDQDPNVNVTSGNSKDDDCSCTTPAAPAPVSPWWATFGLLGLAWMLRRRS